MNRTKLSIIIVNWNTQALLKQCLESVLNEKQKAKNNKQFSIEVIVVDNGSTDGSVEWLRQFKVPSNKLLDKQNSKFKVMVVQNTENLGFGKANNQGIKVATGEYIMLLNSDTIVNPGALEQLVDYLAKHPDTAVSPSLKLPNGQYQNDYYMKFPNLWQIILYHNPLLRPLAIKLNIARGLLFNTQGENSFIVDQLPGAAIVASKETWDKVGGLDENYRFFFEDVDWSWRAMQKGIKRVVDPTVVIIHLGGASWKQKINNNKTLVYRQFFSSMLLFCQKNYSPYKYQLMHWTVVINMIITLKFTLAWYFIKTPTKQTNLW